MFQFDNTGLPEHLGYQVGYLRFDNIRGDGAEGKHRLTESFWVEMTPRVFLDLVPPMEFDDDDAYIGELARGGLTFLPPELVVDFDPDFELESLPQIVNHDGRHRMSHIYGIAGGDFPVPVLVRALGGLQRVDAESLVTFRTGAWAQWNPDYGDRSLVKGPLFGDAHVSGIRHGTSLDQDIFPFLR